MTETKNKNTVIEYSAIDDDVDKAYFVASVVKPVEDMIPTSNSEIKSLRLRRISDRIADLACRMYEIDNNVSIDDIFRDSSELGYEKYLKRIYDAKPDPRFEYISDKNSSSERRAKLQKRREQFVRILTDKDLLEPEIIEKLSIFDIDDKDALFHILVGDETGGLHHLRTIIDAEIDGRIVASRIDNRYPFESNENNELTKVITLDGASDSILSLYGIANTIVKYDDYIPKNINKSLSEVTARKHRKKQEYIHDKPYQAETIAIFLDENKVAKKNMKGNTLSGSTMFPDSWSTNRVISAILEVVRLDPDGMVDEDKGGLIHRAVIDDVTIEVKTTGKVSNKIIFAWPKLVKDIAL